MKLLNIKEEQNWFILTASVEENLFKNFYNSHFSSISKSISIPGFRKGHAPMDMVVNSLIKRNTISKEYEKISSKIIDKFSSELVKEEDWKEKIFPLAFERKIEKFSVDNWEFIFEAKFEKIPFVVLDDYSKIYTLLEDKDLSNSLCPIPKDGTATNKDVVALSMVGKGSDGEVIEKYTYDVLEIDLENTKIRKDIIDSIIGSKANDKKKISFKDDLFGEITLEMFIMEVREKNILDTSLLEKLKIPAEVTLDTFKKGFLKQYEIHNRFVKHQEILKWIISKKNVVNPSLPMENLKFEAGKIYFSLQKAGRKNVSFEKILLDHIKNLKISLVTREIAKKEKIEIEEKDKEEFVKDIEENSWLYGNRSVDQILNVDEEVVKEYIVQFKVLKFLTKKLSFSS